MKPHLVVSQRPLDAQIARDSGLGFTAIPAAPLSVRPKAGLKFLSAYRKGKSATLKLIEETDAQAMIATGGFVSGPAVAAARKAGTPVSLVSLDAVPGRANRFTAKKASDVFSAFPTHAEAKPLPDAEVIGFPLRRAAVAPESAKPQAAREYFGLEPGRKTLLIFAGSQGARTINQAIARLYERGVLGDWQVLHVTGPSAEGLGPEGIPQGAGVALPFCDRMDLAWRAADTALTRAGAGTVGEAWANAVPSVMLPYPFHNDEHQKHNAAPLVDLGGAVVVKDLIDPAENAQQLAQVFASILGDDAKRQQMAQAMRDHRPPDGAQRLADWVTAQVGA
ncbi:UDP-N-acetylglucosamine--N-acetylmuramyl-(pentapeptide) pyrophosphoryl-undecaprenol N-acetylglucosamine transferase [Algisphaera agarilytica]|uniref:UDP-N-acetylglucosamine--N-acetylmuramyl-(Pentapeptide) pyrophosphoryl-undecaprenol N-acetylglucosamine transferase n=1 Tax=Algisphaera agarilytica TaxID=1385975 RepID=A0A7X0H924_9BACT|nr:UDP-N-acetylglucosamine--N-acetylmuramyl-(pentapeptide) pyrophosphoryl-undecaprenol N-acetylglucosamine transferase [Algisphaera agarilytica]